MAAALGSVVADPSGLIVVSLCGGRDGVSCGEMAAVDCHGSEVTGLSQIGRTGAE